MGLFDKINIDVFNADPKYEKDRESFDSLVEASLKRVQAKHAKDAPPAQDENIFDMIFGSKKGGDDE